MKLRTTKIRNETNELVITFIGILIKNLKIVLFLSEKSLILLNYNLKVKFLIFNLIKENNKKFL